MDKNKMLIDATHPEETRVVVLRHGRVEEFDYESAARKLLRGNIYLAKVTRVEPSLQAAFVEYGGNRHGFLAFNEIHPDYYQIPVADRQVLLQEEAEAEALAEEEADAAAQARSARGETGDESGTLPGLEPQPYFSDADPGTDPAERAALAEHEISRLAATPETVSSDAGPPHSQPPTYVEDLTAESDAHQSSEPMLDAGGEAAESSSPTEHSGLVEVNEPEGAEPEQVEQVGTEDAMEEVPERPRRRMRSYKIQEVIKRRQIILVQVVKEERGNKGAALTTYLSLAGRYTVLMPNTGRGGGISRKITNPQDRKRLKAIASELEVPDGMGLIIRTAGAARSKQEIRRDYEYLLRLWESVRDMTLESTAPCLVYEEGNLIKRSIRDLYSKDIDEIVVAGEAAHREAHDFIRMLAPGGSKNVVRYQDPEPLFARFQIERQLNAMFSPYVNLRSGGYLVINQTEALVSVDVNSGKSTREFSIEETALNTNVEAAEEIARQLKLRDLAGLIVIDFIDMEEKRNNRSVERRLKDALRHDRARIQVGRISHFGLLEMSRQRLRTGVLEGSTSQCPHCQGTGIIRSTESVALAVLRGLEDELMKGRPSSLTALTTANVALYILNHKRSFITDIERRYETTISVQASERMQGGNFAIERSAAEEQAPAKRTERSAVSMDWGFEGGEQGEDREERSQGGEEEGEGRRSPRRRRRRRGESRDEPERHRARGGERREHTRHDSRNGDPQQFEGDHHAHDAADAGGAEHADGNSVDRSEADRPDDEQRGRRRRRGRRGGRNRDRRVASERGSHADRGAESDAHVTSNGLEPTNANGRDTEEHSSIAEQSEAMREQAHDSIDSNVRQRAEDHETDHRAAAHQVDEPSRAAHDVPAEVKGEPTRERRDESASAVQMTAPSPTDDGQGGPARKGWWQRRFSGG